MRSKKWGVVADLSLGGGGGKSEWELVEVRPRLALGCSTGKLMRRPLGNLSIVASMVNEVFPSFGTLLLVCCGRTQVGGCMFGEKLDVPFGSVHICVATPVAG